MKIKNKRGSKIDPCGTPHKHGLIMSHIDLNFFAGIVLRLLDLFFRKQIKFSVE